MKANKEAWMAAEKQRRDAFVKEKSNEIKNNTIKGMEPEIEKIIQRNKLEIKKLEEKHKKDLER